VCCSECGCSSEECLILKYELHSSAAKSGHCDCSTRVHDRELTSSCERSHSVDQARVGPKLKHTVVSQLGFESGTALNEKHSHYSVTTCVMLLSDEEQSVRVTSEVHDCVDNANANFNELNK
jgi:hypothetical protein